MSPQTYPWLWNIAWPFIIWKCPTLLSLHSTAGCPAIQLVWSPSTFFWVPCCFGLIFPFVYYKVFGLANLQTLPLLTRSIHKNRLLERSSFSKSILLTVHHLYAPPSIFVSKTAEIWVPFKTRIYSIIPWWPIAYQRSPCHWSYEFSQSTQIQTNVRLCTDCELASPWYHL